MYTYRLDALQKETLWLTMSHFGDPKIKLLEEFSAWVICDRLHTAVTDAAASLLHCAKHNDRT